MIRRRGCAFFIGLFCFSVLAGCSAKSKTEVKKTKKVSTTTESVRQTMKKKQWVIELDPGHGGVDSGAVGKFDGKKVLEKDVNLKIAYGISDALASYPNIKIRMTRSSDTKPGLEERVSKAKKDGADLFISLHNNAYGGGVEYDHGCTVLVPTGYYRKEVASKAQVLGCHFLEQLKKTGLENQGFLMRTSEKNQKYPNGKLQDYYHVIQDSIYKNIPGVIVEHSFVDHAGDYQKFLSSDEKIQKMAKADAQAIVDYCLGSHQKGQQNRQKVTLMVDGKKEHNQYFYRKFLLH